MGIFVGGCPVGRTKNRCIMDTFYKEDILGEGFLRTTISLRDDYEGPAVATLVRRLSDTGNSQSVLYIHGFNDYFSRGRWRVV